ncbi:glycosyltransferase [Cryobacterium sp. GrIS_2_6]|uniref:glycosyltransferase n=1 Tax=Cryobacterium sp. GrIS_2_6 TaxID=3162785 RepID=UPI002E0D0443|nr:glycosyltransferase involved in cell wall biosynthesis [Cryobacterium psychrotolerans]
MSIRILQVLLSPRIGGAESLVAALQDAWEDEGIVAKTVYVDPGRAGGRFRRWSELRKEIRFFGPEVIVAHSAIPGVYARSQFLRSIPVISVIHSAQDDHKALKLLIAEKILRRWTAAVVTVSAGQAADYRRHFSDRVPVSVIPNGISDKLPLKEFHASRVRRISEIARVTDQKEPRLWISAAEEFLKIHGDVEFDWWGPFDEDARRKYHLPTLSPISFRGPTTVAGQVLLETDIYFHTSTREAHSIGLLEAAAVGVPIVCSKSVALTLPDHLPAAVFDDGDPLAAAAALEIVVSSFTDCVARAYANATQVRAVSGIVQCRQAYDDVIASVLRPKE